MIPPPIMMIIHYATRRMEAITKQQQRQQQSLILYILWPMIMNHQQQHQSISHKNPLGIQIQADIRLHNPSTIIVGHPYVLPCLCAVLVNQVSWIWTLKNKQPSKWRSHLVVQLVVLLLVNDAPMQTQMMKMITRIISVSALVSLKVIEITSSCEYCVSLILQQRYSLFLLV